MKINIGQIQSYNNGSFIIENKYKREWKELINLIKKLPYTINNKKINKGTRANTNRHKLLVKMFNKNKWTTGNFKSWNIDAFKKFPVEFELSFCLKALGTITKLNTLFVERKIDVGVIVVYDENVPKTKAIQGGSVPTIKRIYKKYLNKSNKLFCCPLVLVSIKCGDNYEKKFN